MDPFIIIATAILNKLTTSSINSLGGALSRKGLKKNDLALYLEKLTNRTAYFVTYRHTRQHVRDAYIKPHLINGAVTRMHIPPDQYKKMKDKLEKKESEDYSDRNNRFSKESISRLNSIGHLELELNYIPFDDLVSSENNHVILGDAGDGKSSLLACLCWTRLNSKKPRIPIFIDSRQLRNDSLLNCIQESLKEAGFALDKSSLSSLGRAFVIYVDGLDELNHEQYANICLEINLMNSEYPEIQFGVTCRSGAYNGCFEHMQEVSIAPFDSMQSEKFVCQWFKGIDKGPNSTELIQQLRSGDRLKELATKPLMLALMCSAFRRYLNLSRRPTALFQQCIDSLLWEWDAQRTICREGSFSGLDLEKKVWIHSLLAVGLHEGGLKYCNAAHSLELLQPHMTKFGITSDNANVVIAELVSHHSLFVKWTEDTYGFGHLAIQEFLAARWYRNERRWESLLTKERVSDSWWEYVIALSFASMDDATEAVRRLYDFDEVSEIRRLEVAAHCLRYDPVIDASIRDSIIQKILGWYHNGDAQFHNAALFMLVGMEDDWTAPIIRRSLAGALTQSEHAKVMSHRAHMRSNSTTATGCC